MTLPQPIKIVIADDHEIYRDGLKIMLKKQTGFEIVGEAANGKDLVGLGLQLQPDVILTDIVMPIMDGIESTRVLHKSCPATNIIALSMFDQDTLIIEMLEAGAKGYLLKNADKAEIVEAIKSVHRNVPYYCRSTSHKLARMIGQSRFHPDAKIKTIVFSSKEKEIITLICEEFTNKEIGTKLFLGTRTVEGYRMKIMDKMGVKSTAGIVIYAIKNGLFKAEK